MSDVKLEGQQVIIEAWDVVVESEDRRSLPRAQSPQRRALVHDFDDGLTINWSRDYPGGVTIQGEVKTEDLHAQEMQVTGALIVPLTFDLRTGDIFAPSEVTRQMLSIAFADAGRFREEIDAGRIVLPGRSGTPQPQRSSVPSLSWQESRAALNTVGHRRVDRITLPVDLVKMVTELAEEVEQLKKQVQKLENA